MKKIIILLALLTISGNCLLFSNTSHAKIDIITGEKMEEEKVEPSGPLTKTHIPVPFKPIIESVPIDITSSEGKALPQVKIGDQSVPIFDITTDGMRFIITVIFFIAGPLTLIMLVYSGIKLIVMPENEEEQARTKRTLIFSAIGLLVIAFSYALVQNILKIF